MKEHLKGHRNLACMVLAHVPTWREALEHQKIDQHDTSFLDHELKELGDIENACIKEIGNASIPT